MSQSRASARLCLVVLAASAYGCAGEGCDCLAELEESFPIAARQHAGVQVRLTDSGFRFLSENAFELLADQIGDSLTFPVPPDCSSDPSVCCGYPVGFCSMELDLADYGEGSHIEIEALEASGNRLGITIYPRVRTLRPMPARTYGPLGGAIDCNVEFNTRWSGSRWMWIHFEVVLGENPDSGELGVSVSTAQVGGISAGDINIYGDFLCRFGSEQDAINGIAAGFRSQIPGAIEEFLCASCTSDSDCGDQASCDDGVCRAGSGDCQQSFSIAGQHQAGDLLGPLLGRAVARKLDLYFAAGSEAISEDDGLSLAVTSGMEPAASPADHHCVPVVPEPPRGAMGLEAELRGNTHPVTGEAYDLGAAIHVGALNHGAWAAHQAGYICLDLGTRRVENLNSDAMLLVAPSLGNVFEERDRQPMFVLVRPQTAPAITLGEGTFTEPGDDGTVEIDDPLVKISLGDLELDFYAFIDERYARIFTVVADAELGVSFDVDGEGGLIPLLDDPASALSNIRAKNITFIAETEGEIAERIPSILGVALGGLAGEIGDAIALPDVAGLAIKLAPGAFARTASGERLAMFANLEPGAPGSDRAVDTRIVSAELAPGESALHLEVDADAGDVEWQFRLGGGFWSPFNRGSRATIRRAALAASGNVSLEVRARRVGLPGTLDATPARVRLEAALASDTDGSVIAFHGEDEGGGGCGDCSSGGSGSGGAGAALLALLAMLLSAGRRRLALVALALALAVPGCSCGSSDDGLSDPDDPNQVQPGPVGRWVSADADGSRVVVAAYERTRGDLVLAELREPGEPRYVAIDGVPDGPVSRDPKGYRGGVDAAGPDVGAWASVRLVDGKAVIAYQDRERGALRLAHETSDGFAVIDVDVASDGSRLGRHASLTVGDGGELGIAYMSVAIVEPAAGEEGDEGDEGEAMVKTELRWASAPSAAGPWMIEVVEAAEASHSARLDVTPGVGLWASAAFISEGPVISHYDAIGGDLRLSRRRGDTWTSSVIDGDGDRGQFSSLARGDGDELFVAYQDADSDQLLLRRITGDAVGAAEVIDDGLRAPDRRHPVGASARLVVTGDELVVAYQDSAAATLLLARRPRPGGPWQITTAVTPGAGFAIGLAINDTIWTATGLYAAGRGHLEAQRW